MSNVFWKIMPELPVDNVVKGVEYYTKILGFSINHQEDDIAVLDRDD